MAVVLAGGLALGIAANAVAAAEPVSRTEAPALARPVVQQSRDSYNREIRVHNQTGWTMTYFYTASSGTDGWGDDLLGSATLSPGDSVVVTVDDGSGACRYDFWAEFDNGEALRRSGINVCQIADYYFTR
ncbi:hypothetical protein HZ989_02380 [Brevundimonas sp. AJA228-03]|uniref:hypothetical protein n=1 Tax=Brevundimonas sp. AJA228-03 TaxID=2752515 RepID=UPI001AE0B84E|nr:hypothetical protein [Brevundimonas sp. AJA228-03]QTN19947.1 hypothetical protein HZ989_02380 [Brevundimonas sp. AJA228-03]